MLATIWSKITDSKQDYSIIEIFWLGLGTLGTILTIISLFIPLNTYILIILFVISGIYICFNRELFTSYIWRIKEWFARLNNWNKSITILILAVIIIYQLSTPILYDFGLYHMQSIMWAETYRTVPGLANLHGRFGFNSNFLLLSGIFGYHPNLYPPFFSLNGLCLFIFSIWIVSRIQNSKNIFQQGAYLFLFLIFFYTFVKYVSSTSTDIVAHILVIYILLQLSEEKENPSSRGLLFTVIPIFCITLKLSSAAIILAPLLILIYLVKYKKYKEISLLTTIGAIIMIPWIIRFAILTGYIIYPFPSVDLFNFDWKVPIENVVAEKDAALAWARIGQRPTEEVLAMPFFTWFPIWLKALPHIDLLLYILAFVSPIIIIIYRKYIKNNRTIFAWLIAYAGFIFGFVNAPDPRFGFGFIISCVLLPIFLKKERDCQIMQNIRKKCSIALSLCIIGFMIGFMALALRQVKHYQSDNESVLTLLYKPQSVDNIKTEKEATFTKHSIEDLIIFSPDIDNRCFDQELPCMPYFDSRIEIRGESLQDGFRMKK